MMGVEPDHREYELNLSPLSMMLAVHILGEKKAFYQLTSIPILVHVFCNNCRLNFLNCAFFFLPEAGKLIFLSFILLMLNYIKFSSMKSTWNSQEKFYLFIVYYAHHI